MDVMKSLNSGVKIVSPDTVIEYKMDEDEFSENINTLENESVKHTVKKQEDLFIGFSVDTLDFTKKEVEDINLILGEISLALKKEKEGKKAEDVLHTLLIQKGIELFYEERKNLLADIVLRGLSIDNKKKKEMLVVCKELSSVEYAREKEIILHTEGGRERMISEGGYCSVNYQRMGEKLSESTNVMSTMLDF